MHIAHQYIHIVLKVPQHVHIHALSQIVHVYIHKCTSNLQATLYMYSHVYTCTFVHCTMRITTYFMLCIYIHKNFKTTEWSFIEIHRDLHVMFIIYGGCSNSPTLNLLAFHYNRLVGGSVLELAGLLAHPLNLTQSRHVSHSLYI